MSDWEKVTIWTMLLTAAIILPVVFCVKCLGE